MVPSLKGLPLWQLVHHPSPSKTSKDMNQMAVRASCHHPFSIAAPRSGTRKATMIRFISSPLHSCSFSNVHLSKAAAPIRMMFEDQVRGVVCYRDDKGEVICEGYDEGPRFGMRLPEKACFPWPMGVQVTDFIELSALRVFEDVDVRSAAQKGSEEEELN
ncbi:hypothetical protein GUJ93_ZPchr0002g25036 [Zizania palustris]|uniref:Uncharacterized protein n=1 Tax=Zizania palustris TaxID=103762 RepID=A0A8J5V4P0_ZIZPA|nr:hypothetical protein GUJ93_ZPchr0002g25036 [Zizania palustris]